MKKALSIMEIYFCAGVGIQADFYKMMQGAFQKHNRCQYNDQKQTIHLIQNVYPISC